MPNNPGKIEVTPTIVRTRHAADGEGAAGCAPFDARG